MNELTEAVRRAAAAETREEFQRRVEAQAEDVLEDVRSGRLDNRNFSVGLELEAYAVDADGRLAPVPEAAFDAPNCSRELGVHNVEAHTHPDAAAGTGFRRQATTLETALDDARAALREADRELVLDGMWTVPPAEGTEAYLDAGTETDGVFLAENMRPIARYVAIDEAVRARAGGRIPIGLPGLADARSILVESLTTSIQPHLQIPTAADLPRYLNVATRTMGPVLSLATNSPFLPADRYEGLDPEAVLAETPHECRVPVFERSVNVAGVEKCRVPEDYGGVADVIDRIVEDETLAPVLSETGDADADADADGDDSYASSVPEFVTKRGTFWRWVRPVFGGDVPRGDGGDATAPENDDASVRIEYRPLPTQPTVRDAVGLQALVVGLVHGIVVADHPVEHLPWADARDSFYAAVADGPDADLEWVGSHGDRMDAAPVVRDELFSLARHGLREMGVEDETAEWLLSPIEARQSATHTSPSAWKRARVRERLDAGESLPDAVRAMQREYVEQAATGRAFATWDRA
ncbi:hypothetical protein [Halopelagius longus]|uniref:Glutamate--cysteine ligase n=1 Tax=Halopelagius longus TaxID=1236180 RepID=A0A1H0YKM9_9EURY|nr:hypothetical protein [Halopelagius longus]RDI72540.1 hypothetical protein DWB78_12890 [Halopelagius longus]SDQ15744.1 hypothetical protein SAMN05216278_0695 [Halopelagius longus]